MIFLDDGRSKKYGSGSALTETSSWVSLLCAAGVFCVRAIRLNWQFHFLRTLFGPLLGRNV